MPSQTPLLGPRAPLSSAQSSGRRASAAGAREHGSPARARLTACAPHSCGSTLALSAVWRPQSPQSPHLQSSESAESAESAGDCTRALQWGTPVRACVPCVPCVPCSHCSHCSQSSQSSQTGVALVLVVGARLNVCTVACWALGMTLMLEVRAAGPDLTWTQPQAAGECEEQSPRTAT